MMRRFVLLVALLVMRGSCGPLLAQESQASNAAAPAAVAPVGDHVDAATKEIERAAAEEHYKQLNARIEDLLTAQEVQQKRINALAEELKKSREDMSVSLTNFVTREEMKDLVEKIKELDKKRQADKELILGEFEKMQKLIASLAAAVKAPKAPAIPDKPDPQKQANGYTHKVEKGENLSVIVQAYNLKFKEMGLKTVSQKQVRDANPGKDLDHLQIDQIVLIPDPGKR